MNFDSNENGELETDDESTIDEQERYEANEAVTNHDEILVLKQVKVTFSRKRVDRMSSLRLTMLNTAPKLFF